MDDNLKKIIPYVKKYKTNVVWNIIFNTLYAIFSTLGFVMIIPVMNVLFGEDEKITKLPTYQGIWKIKEYLSNTLYYYINYLTELKGAQYALYLIISILIFTFLVKNLFGFLGLQHLLKLRTGVLRDFRDQMYSKVIALPISYY